MRRLRLERWLHRIITIYNNGNMKSKRRKTKEMSEELEEEIFCIGGDFNAKIGKEGKRIEGKEDLWRNSKDKEINNKGKKPLSLGEDRG